MSNETTIEILRNRLAVAMKHRNVSAKALARTAGLGETVVRDIIRGMTQDVRLGTVEKIAQALGLSVGDLLPDAFGRAASRSMTDVAEEEHPCSPDDGDEVEIQQWNVAYGMGGGTYLDIPVTGDTHRFSGGWIRQFSHAPANRLFFASGTGDSMTPTILDSDIVLIDTSERDVRVGDKIWAIAVGEVGYIKRLRPKADGTVTILSDNPNVPDDSAADGDMSIVGRVVAIVRKT